VRHSGVWVAAPKQASEPGPNFTPSFKSSDTVIETATIAERNEGSVTGASTD
jgi:hypothetical protein